MDTLLIAPIVNFAIVAGVLVYVGRKPMRDFLSSRNQTIAASIADGEKLYAEASAQLQQWESNWNAVETHAETARQEAKTMISRQREKALAAAKSEAERVRQDASLIGQSEAVKARKLVEREIVERSIHLASNFLKGHLEDTDRTRLVGEYLEKLSHGKA